PTTSPTTVAASWRCCAASRSGRSTARPSTPSVARSPDGRSPYARPPTTSSTRRRPPPQACSPSTAGRPPAPGRSQTATPTPPSPGADEWLGEVGAAAGLPPFFPFVKEKTMLTAAEFKTLREHLGIPGEWLARRFGVSDRSVRHWDSGKYP